MENKKLYGKICYLQREMNRENHFIFAEYGITPVQLHVLIFLHIKSKEGVSICQKDIERYLNMRASSVSSLLATLENKDFITRTVADGDARTKYVQIAEKGKKICIKNKLLMEKCDSIIQEALTVEEQETFKSLLDKIIKEIEKQEKEV